MGWVENATPAVNAESQYQTIIAICVVLSALSIAVVCARLWIRYSARGLAADDCMAALSMVFALIYSVPSFFVETKYGLGLPIAMRPAADLIPYTRVNYAGRPFYQLGISFFKIALLISYLRLFKGTNQRAYRATVWTSIAAIFLGHLGCTLSLIFACRPVDKSWNPLTPGTCLPNGPSFTAYAAVTIVSDVIVALLPIPALLKLNMPSGKKVGLIGIFLLGLFTTVCSVLRYLQINRIQYGDGNSTMLVLWGTIEFNVGNMVSSLPFLAPVFMRKAKGYLSKPSNGYGSSGGRSGERPRRADHYKLGSVRNSVRNSVGAFAIPSGQSTSQENILRESPENSIVKSVSYTVRVDEPLSARKNLGSRGRGA